MNRVFTYLLMLFGEALIILTSFLFLKEIEPTELFALNTVVISIVYLLIYSLTFDLFNFIKLDSDSSTAGWGMYGYGMLLYSLLAIAGVVLSYYWELELYTSLLFHGGVLFILFLFLLFAGFMSGGVKSSMDKNEERKTSLKDIKYYLEMLDINSKTDPSKESRIAQVESLKSQVRFITYSDNRIAQDLEAELTTTLVYMLKIPNVSQTDRDSWRASVDRCNALIELRKQQH